MYVATAEAPRYPDICTGLLPIQAFLPPKMTYTGFLARLRPDYAR